MENNKIKRFETLNDLKKFFVSQGGQLYSKEKYISTPQDHSTIPLSYEKWEKILSSGGEKKSR